MAEDDQDEKIDTARRRLFRYAVYVPPVVLGAVALSQAAGCAISCSPSSCQPGNQCGPTNCHPAINPCNPSSCNPNA